MNIQKALFQIGDMVVSKSGRYYYLILKIVEVTKKGAYYSYYDMQEGIYKENCWFDSDSFKRVS